MSMEKIVFDHLKTHLDVPVSFEVLDVPDFVFLERLGGSETNHIRHGSFAVQSYGSSLLKACELNEKAKTAMKQLIESNEISAVSLDSDYSYTDTTTKRYRYQAVFDVVFF